MESSKSSDFNDIFEIFKCPMKVLAILGQSRAGLGPLRNPRHQTSQRSRSFWSHCVQETCKSKVKYQKLLQPNILKKNRQKVKIALAQLAVSNISYAMFQLYKCTLKCTSWKYTCKYFLLVITLFVYKNVLPFLWH